VGLGEHPLAGRNGGDGVTRGVGQLEERLARRRWSELRPRHEHRPRCFVQQLGGVVRGVGQSGGVARWRRAEAPGTRRRDRHRSKVTGDLQHHWLATPQRQVDRPVDQRRGVDRVPHREGSGGDLCIDLPLIIVSHLAQGVVDDFVLPLRVGVDPAHNDNDR
jgi:hypothetical protein